MKKILIVSVALFVLTVSSLLVYSNNYINSPSGILTENVIIEIEPGTSFYSAAAKLKEKGVIDNVRKFHLYAKYRGDLNSIKTGEYNFEPNIIMRDVLDRLVKGNVIKHRLTVPEGYNLYQIAGLLEEKGIVKKENFIKKSFDRKLLKSLNIKGESFEGHLYPETYFLVKGMTSEDIIRKMVSRLKAVFTDEFVKRGQELGFTPEEVINFASIIEKETGNPDERPLISAAFHNRLKKGMRLQSDPTVIYGMIESFDGDIRKKDLRKKTPYNTYRINGLPKGPIANPGVASIKAALYPADVDHIYFVSMNNGSHVFAKTLKQHNRNVWKYQKRKKR